MKAWTPKLYVVEVWWQHHIDEWLFEAAFTTRKDAEAHAKSMRKTKYRYRVVPYLRDPKVKRY